MAPPCNKKKGESVLARLPAFARAKRRGEGRKRAGPRSRAAWLEMCRPSTQKANLTCEKRGRRWRGRGGREKERELEWLTVEKQRLASGPRVTRERTEMDDQWAGCLLARALLLLHPSIHTHTATARAGIVMVCMHVCMYYIPCSIDGFPKSHVFADTDGTHTHRRTPAHTQYTQAHKIIHATWLWTGWILGTTSM